MWVICGSHPNCSVDQWVNRCNPLSTLVLDISHHGFLYYQNNNSYTHIQEVRHYCLMNRTNDFFETCMCIYLKEGGVVKHLCHLSHSSIPFQSTIPFHWFSLQIAYSYTWVGIQTVEWTTGLGYFPFLDKFLFLSGYCG